MRNIDLEVKVLRNCLARLEDSIADSKRTGKGADTIIQLLEQIRAGTTKALARATSLE